jgi:hypothetical protein
MELRTRFECDSFGTAFFFLHDCTASLVRFPSCLVRPGPRGDPVSDPMQPACDGVRITHRVCLARRDQKRGLECVLSIVRIAENLPANAQHHRSVPVDERGERDLFSPVSAGQITVEELAV